jgi:hypothetical protein
LHCIPPFEILVEAELFEKLLHPQSPYIEDFLSRRAHLDLARVGAVREDIRNPTCRPAARPHGLREGREARELRTIFPERT